MAKTYTTTIKLACWKVHTCISCGATYQYWFQRTIKGKASSAGKSQKRAATAREKALASDVDLHPCPACGLYQPDMIGQQRARSHKFTFWIILCVFGALLIVRAADGLQANVALWISGVAAMMALLQFAGKDFKNINRDPRTNLEKLSAPLGQGTVQLNAGKPAPPAAQWLRPARSPMQTIVLAAMGLAVVLIVSAELLRIGRGWPLNTEAYPPVMGPGDQARVYMDQKIHSIKSYWRGEANVKMSTPGGQPILVQASTNQNNWDQTISVKSDERDSSSTPWVNVQLPNDPALAGQMVQGEIALAVERPVAESGNSYAVQRSEMTRNLTLHLAKNAGAGASYNQLWWAGNSIGMAILLIGGLILISLSRRFQRQALPTQIFFPPVAGSQATPPALPAQA